MLPLLAALWLALPARASSDLQPSEMCEDWTIGPGGASSIDPMQFVQDSYDKLVELAELDKGRIPSLHWREHEYLERYDVIPGESADARSKRLRQDGVRIICDGEPDFGHTLHAGNSPGSANICSTDGKDEYGIVALSQAIFDFAGSCAAPCGREVFRHHVMRWVLAHELAHVKLRHPLERAKRYEGRCVGWLTSEDPLIQAGIEARCNAIPGCAAAMQTVATAKDPKSPEMVRLSRGILRALCEDRFRTEMAADQVVTEQAADDFAKALMKKWADTGEPIDPRAGECAMVQLRAQESGGWYGPPPAAAAYQTHPPTEERIERQREP